MKKLDNNNQEQQIKIIGENAKKVLEIIENKKQEKNKEDGEER